jgi:translation initiation factor IF-1
MADSPVVLLDGIIVENLPNTMFRVKLTDSSEVMGYLSGRMRRNFIRLLPGDKVRVEFTPYDKTKGRIVLKIK